MKKKRGSAKRQREKRAGQVEIHPFVLIANHQLSEKHPVPKTPRSILTSRCVVRVRNFAPTRNPDGFHCALNVYIHTVCIRGYISLVLLHGSRSSILLTPPFPYLVSKRPCVRVRARSYQLAHTSMFEVDLLGVLPQSKSAEWDSRPKRPRNLVDSEDYSSLTIYSQTRRLVNRLYLNIIFYFNYKRHITARFLNRKFCKKYLVRILI